jgi:hypothetical protein
MRIEHTQQFIGRGSQQLKDAISDPSLLKAPAQWPEAMQQGMHSVINLARDTALAPADDQIDTLRLLQNQATEAQKVISATLSEQLKSVKAAEKH